MASVSTAELRILITAQDMASAQLARTINGMGSLAQKATQTGAQMTRSLTLPAGLLAGSIVKEAADFEQTLNVLVNTTREAGKNTQDAAAGFDDAGTRMAAFREEALRLGADLKIPATSAADAATAMDELSKAGLSVTQTLAAARGTVQLAAAFGVEEAKAADIMSAALLAFGMRGEEAGHVANMLARATEVSRAKFSDFSVAIRQGAGAFQVTGRPLEEFLGMIGVLVDRGVSGGVAATSLRRAVTAVAAPTALAAKTMKQYGVELFDTEGKLKAWPDIIDNLNQSFEGLNPKETFAAIKNIFGQEGFKSIAPLLNATKQSEEAMQELTKSFDAGEINAEQYREEMDKLTASHENFTDQLREKIASIKESNAADLIATARTKGLWGALDGLQSSVETVAVTLGTPFLERLANLARGFADLATRFGLWMDQRPRLLEFVATFGAIVAAIGPALFIFGRLLTMLGLVMTPLGMLTVAVATFAGAWAANLGDIQGITHSALGGVIEWLQQAGDGLAAWAEQAGPIGTIVGKVFTGISEVIQSFRFSLQGNLGAAQAMWDAAMGHFGEAGGVAVEEISKFVDDVLDTIDRLLGIDTSEATDTFTRLWEILGKLGSIGMSGLQVAANVLKEIGSLTYQGLDKAADFLIKLEGFTFSAPDLSLFDKLREVSAGGFSNLMDLLARLENFKFSSPDLSSFDKLKELSQNAWGNFTTAIENLAAALPKLKLSEDFGRIAQNIADALKNLSDVIQGSSFDYGKTLPPKDAGQQARHFAADLKFISATLVTFTGALEQSSGIIRSWFVMLQALVDVAPLLATAMKEALTPGGDVGKGRTAVDQAREVMAAAHKEIEGIAKDNEASQERTRKSWEEYNEFIKSGAIDTANEVAAASAQTNTAIESTGAAAQKSLADLGDDFADVPAQIPEVADQIEAGLAPVPKAIDQVAADTQLSVDQLGTKLDGVVSSVEAVGPQVEVATTQIGQGATTGIATGLEPLPPTAEGVMEDVRRTIAQKSQEAVDEVTSLGPRMAQGSSEIFSGIAQNVETEFAPIAESVSSTMDTVTTTVSEGWNSIGPNTTAALTTLDATVQSTFNTIVTSVAEGFTSIVTTAQTQGAELVTSWQDTWSKSLTIMAEPLANMGTQIQEAWNTIQTNTASTLDTINSTVQTGFATMQTNVQTAGTTMETTLKTTWDTINSTVTTSIGTLVSSMESGGQTMSTTMQTTWQTIQESSASTWATINSTVTTSIGTLVMNMTEGSANMVNTIVQGGAQMVNSIVQTGAEMVTGMVNSLANLANVVAQGVTQAIGAVTSRVGEATAAGASLGAAIANGFTSAVQTGAARAARVASDMISSAINAARAAADAHSPSRKTAQLGTDMIDGLVNAISNGQSRVADAVKVIIKEAMDANIDPMVALALAKAESSFNARAKGDSGRSIGLFQLHEGGQGAGMSVAQREDPTVNARKFLQSHKELFAQMKSEITDTTELVRRFGVAAEQPADQTGAAYVAAYQQIRESIMAAGGSVAEMVDNQDAFTAALGESVDSAASLTPLLERQLALKEEAAALDVKMLAGKQNLDRLERSISQIEGGTREQKLAALAGSKQDNALLQQELQLKMLLAKAEASAPKDTKTGKTKGSQEVADIKAALELLGDQREQISLTAQLTKAENEARTMGLKEQALLQQEALKPMEDQQFLLGQQTAQIDALNTAWQAAQATIQNANSTENAARREVIATMREQAGANTDIKAAGQAALQEMLSSGRITQQEFEKYSSILQTFGAAAIQSTQGAVTGIQAIGSASTTAGQDVQQTGQALVTASTQIQGVGQAGAQAAQVLATTAAQGFASFAADAGVAAQNAVNSVITILNDSASAANTAGYNLGVNVGQGLTNGIIESGNAAIEAAVAVANAVIEAMRGPEGFDARSPARKSYFIGQDVMDGLILGLQNPTVSDLVKQRIQQYIVMAEQYRKLIPEAVDNELRIIGVRTDQAKALLGILDLEFRMKDAQRSAEDARRGSVDDQLRLLTIDKERNELRLKELDHLRAVQSANDAIEATQRAIEEIEKGTLEERLHQLEVDHAINILKKEQLILEQQVQQAKQVVETTERAIQAIERGTLADQYRSLELDHQKAMLKQQELDMADELLAAKWDIEDTERKISDIEKGTLADRQAELALDNEKNILSKERIGLEHRLRQIHEAGINKDLSAFSGTGLQIVDPTDPLQQEVNELHNRLALIDDQNKLLEDEGEIRRLNGQIASYEYRLQLLSQQDLLQTLDDQQQALDRQNALLQLESDIRENNVELAKYALEVQLVAEQAALTAIEDQATALDDQIKLLEYEGQLRQINADIAKYALLVQLETQQEVLKGLEAQTTAFDRQNAALDEEAERIRIANDLRAYGAAAQAIVLEDEHLKQQRVIDDLDRQYEALNRQKQVYDVILRAVDYLHDHLIDEGIIEDPFAVDHTPVGPDPTDPSSRAGGSSSARAGGAAAKAGGAMARSAEGISKAMTQAKVDTETFTGNAAAALARLKPVVTDTSTSFDGVTTATETMATDTVAVVDGMGAEIAVSMEAASTNASASVTNMGTEVTTITRDMAGNIIGTTVNMSGQIVSQYATLANGAILNTSGMADTIMTTTTDMGTGVVTTMRDLSGNVITTTTDLAGNITSQYITLGAAVVAAATAQTLGVGEQTTAMATETMATVDQLAIDLGTETTTMATDTITTAEGMAKDMDTTTTTMASDTLTTIEQMAKDIDTATTTMASDTIDTVEGMATDMDTTTTDMATDTVTTVEDMGTDAVAAADEMNTDVVVAMDAMALDATTAAEMMGTDVVAAIDAMGAAATTSAETMGETVATAAETMESDVVGTVEQLASESESNFKELESAAETAGQSLEDIGDVEIAAPDVSDVISAMEDIEEAAKDAAEAVDDVGDDGGGGKHKSKNDATGGVVNPGKMYTVGEFGRELFVPWTKGFIMPHNLTEQILDANKARQAMRDYQPVQLVGAGAGGGTTENTMTVNNFNVQYTAMNQEKKGESDVGQVIKDMITMLSIGGS